MIFYEVFDPAKAYLKDKLSSLCDVWDEGVDVSKFFFYDVLPALYRCDKQFGDDITNTALADILNILSNISSQRAQAKLNIERLIIFILLLQLGMLKHDIFGTVQKAISPRVMRLLISFIPHISGQYVEDGCCARDVFGAVVELCTQEVAREEVLECINPNYSCMGKNRDQLADEILGRHQRCAAELLSQLEYLYSENEENLRIVPADSLRIAT